MTELSNPTVHALMEQALKPIDPATLVIFAAEMTRPKSGWKGPRRMSREEAVAATRLVTEMLDRYDLPRAKVLSSGGHASAPGATSRFFLSREDMRPGAMVTKRLATGIGAYVDNVRAISRHAREAGHETSEETLLGELAEVVAEYLRHFRDEPEIDPFFEIATDVNRIAGWLTSPRRGFELARFLGAAHWDNLDFAIERSEVFHAGPEAAPFSNGIEPTVPLLTRIVAHAPAEVYRRDADEMAEEACFRAKGKFFFNPRPKMDLIGRAWCVVGQKVSLGVRLDRGSLVMAFLIDHAAYVGVPSGGRDNPNWHTNGYASHLEFNGVPRFGTVEPARDERYFFNVAEPSRYECPEFEAFVGTLRDQDYGWDHVGTLRRRMLPVTVESCRLLLSGYAEHGLRDTWRSYFDLPEPTELPEAAINDAGAVSTLNRDRLASLLYSDADPSLESLLHVEAEKRTDAYAAFLLKGATGERRRKLAFRARMRR